MYGGCTQASQFASTDSIKVLAAREFKISKNGKGAWRDCVFVERLWRSMNCEEACLRACARVAEARAGIGRHLAFYNLRRPHSPLDGKTPRSGLLQPADARSGGGMAEAETHLENARNLFRQTEPPLIKRRHTHSSAC